MNPKDIHFSFGQRARAAAITVLAASVFSLIIVGFLNIGHTEEITHTESPDYQTYEPGLEPETPVTFRAVSAEFATYTEVSVQFGETPGGDEYITHTCSAYVILTDENGDQLAAVYRGLVSESDYLSILSVEAEMLINDVNESGGMLYYGTTTENRAADQDISRMEELQQINFWPDQLALAVDVDPLSDHNVLLPKDQYYSLLEEGKDRIETLDCVWITGTEPSTDTVVDSTVFKLDFGIYCLAAAVLIIYILCMLLNRKENKKHRESRRQKTQSPAEEGRMDRFIQMRRDRERRQEEHPAEQKRPEEERIEQEKHLAEQQTAVNARLIPAWDENRNAGLVSALLNSDPLEIQKRIREAGAEDVKIFLQELESEMAAADSEGREVLKTVYEFANGVRKHE